MKQIDAGIFLSSNNLVRFWYQVDAGLSKQSGKFSLFFCSLEDFVKDLSFLLIKYLEKFSSEAS